MNDLNPTQHPFHYRGLTYDSKERFISYWHQVREVMRRRPATVVEVGIGNGFLHRYLRPLGVQVHTVDFDTRLHPDTVASVERLPFLNQSFDLACCFETLEHLPWEKFTPAVRELGRVSKREVALSLPDVSPCVRLEAHIGTHSARHFFELPIAPRRPHVFDGDHYWEINKSEYPFKRILTAISDAGMLVTDTFRVPEYPYHRFISLERA